MNEKVFLQDLGTIASYYPLFVFVGPVERCSLENFSSVWHAATACVQTFQKKKKIGDVECMETQSG
jgi:hypothetical protein